MDMRVRLFLVFFFFISLILLGTALVRTATPPPSEAAARTPVPNLRDWGPAPELSNEIWINTGEPLRLADLRGKVILLEMWTYGCYNCRNVLPSLKDWHEHYANQGLVIIGNHYPEFAHEEDLENLKKAVTELEIPYAIAQDNDGVTWRAYSNRYWPTLYLIDKRGHIRYTQIGEGNYEQTEAAIQALLAEPAP